MREFGSEFPEIILPDGFYNFLQGFGEHVFVRSGREALALCAKSIRKNSGVALLPALSCDSMIAPFTLSGFTSAYYRLNKDLTIDCGYLEKMLNDVNPDIVLTMNYFGLADTTKAIEVIKNHSENCIVVEDFSHCLFSLSEIFNNRIDYYAASLRKSLGINDGGILISKCSIDKTKVSQSDTDFVALRRSAQAKKLLYNHTCNSNVKLEFRAELSKAEHILNEFDDIYAMSDDSRARLELINYHYIARVRKEHYIKIKEELKATNGIELINSILIPTAPFSLPIIVPNQEIFQKELSRRGVYAPVLWPIRVEQSKTCHNSKYFSEHMLSIPIDQRYDYNDINDIASIIKEVAHIQSIA